MRVFRLDPKAEKKFYTIEAVWNALKCKDYRVRECVPSLPQPSIAPCAFCSRLIPWCSYVTFCNEQNIQRVLEPDRMNITKFGRCLLVPSAA